MTDDLHEAALYDKLEDKRVGCYLCSFRCKIADGKRGVCGVRENRGGILYALDYGRIIARSLDPIEKKPLFHFYPGSASYSIATAGCNFRCLHCQNADISQGPRETGEVVGSQTTPDEVVTEALISEARSIAYTYTEPTIFYEFALDTMRLAKDKGIANVFVTNGYMTKECLDTFGPIIDGNHGGLLDAANVDVKAFKESTYKKVCGARLAPVLENVERMFKMGIWVEVTTLIIPGVNDEEAELRGIARWLKGVSDSIPWHLSAFYPAYKMMDVPPTPSKTVTRAREIGLEEGLRYVYTGNLTPGDEGESTFCYNCGECLILRRGYTIKKNIIQDSSCPKCNSPIHGVGL